MVDISHPNFEEQINIVNQTLHDINKNDKTSYLIFNKIDAFTYVKKDDDDLTPKKRENYSLKELEKSWMAKNNAPCLFISAKNKINIEEFKNLLYDKVRNIHVQRFPYNDFLY